MKFVSSLWLSRSRAPMSLKDFANARIYAPPIGMQELRGFVLLVVYSASHTNREGMAISASAIPTGGSRNANCASRNPQYFSTASGVISLIAVSLTHCFSSSSALPQFARSGSE
jgi:hypothetical protein